MSIVPKLRTTLFRPFTVVIRIKQWFLHVVWSYVKNHKKGLLTLIILVVILGLFLWLSILRKELITVDNLSLFGIFLAIVVFSFSTFLSLRTILLYHSRMADANVYSYALQAETSDIYKKIARNWNEYAKTCREEARRRAYSVNLCCYSIILTLIGIIVIVGCEKLFYPSLILFGMSTISLVLAFAIYVAHEVFKPLSWAKWPVDHKLPRWIEKGFINNHDWLKTAVEWEDTVEKEDDC